MIDLHSHILPGVDDGARDLAESVAIARAAAADGTRVIAATPHVRSDYPTPAATMRRLVAVVRNMLEAEGVELELLSGGEIALPELQARELEELRAYGLGGNPAYLLVETPYHSWPLAYGEIVFRLRAAGIIPVIAHPERNADVQRDPTKVLKLVAGGALVQLTAASLDGRLGRAARACAERLVELEAVHLLASDAHAPDLRAVGLSKARRSLGDERLGRWLTETVPAAIVSGSPLPPRPPSAPRRGLFRRRRAR